MITDILKGIDRCDDEYTDGWWETSSGATFGRSKLIEAQGYECGLLQRITELEVLLVDTKRDAERYQFLEHQCRTGTYNGIISRDAIDAASQVEGKA